MPCHAFSIQMCYTAILYWINTVLIIIPQDSITRGWAAQRIGGYINITCRTLWIPSREAALDGFSYLGVHFHPLPLRSILISSSLLQVGLPSDLFPSGFPNKTLYASLLSRCACYIPSQTPPRLDHANNIYWTEQIMTLLYSQFFSNPSFPRRLDPYYSLHVTDQIRHPRKTTGRNTISYFFYILLTVHLNIFILILTNLMHWI